MRNTHAMLLFVTHRLQQCNLCLRQKAKGWDTCPIGGYNAKALVEEFQVSERYLPIMLITLGEASVKGHPSSRMDISRTTEWM
ncbi:hypothetical protein GCM10020331_042970 [Ectobacillus funiculus]